MAENRKQTIKIESILGGISPATHFAARDQFRAALAIDPMLSASEVLAGTMVDYKGTGLLRPVSTKEFGNGVVTGVPLWIKSTPKNGITYLYSNRGSVYTVSEGVNDSGSITELSDLNDGGSSQGNGMAYYDNYMYFARSTTIARYGPLDSTATFTDDYWVTTLSKPALTDPQYPNDSTLGFEYPNHVMHRHSDGKLYFVDVQDNKGTIHYISTTKGADEGDTDSGSTENALQFGYNLYPTALETYGSDLVIALMERRSGNFNGGDSYSGAKIAFWDTVSQNFNRIIWNSFPDGFISALKNINGVLYIISGTFNESGFRVSRYIGGDSVEEVFYSETGQVPTPGAVDGDGRRLLFGSRTDTPEQSGCIWSYGLQKSGFNGIYNVAKSPATTSATSNEIGVVTAFNLYNGDPLGYNAPSIIGWATNDSSTAGLNGVDIALNDSGLASPVSNFDTSPAIWWSQVYRIGQPFKITKIRIPLLQPLSSTKSVVPKVWIDGGTSSSTLQTINSTNYGTSRQSIVIRPENLTGDNDFWLELKWGGTSLTVVSLPITIEYELLDVDSTKS